MHVCMSVCGFVYVCICDCAHVSLCERVFVHVCMCLWVCMWMCVWVYVYKSMCVHVCTCVRVHVYRTPSMCCRIYYYDHCGCVHEFFQHASRVGGWREAPTMRWTFCYRAIASFRAVPRAQTPKNTYCFLMVSIKQYCITQCFATLDLQDPSPETSPKPFQKPPQIETSKSWVCVYIYT